MTFKRTVLAAAVCVMGVYQSAFADVGEDIKEGILIETALNDAVSEGFTIDQAVTDAIAVNPEMAKDIVFAAIAILDNLPDAACTVVDRESTKSNIDRSGCDQRITAAAIIAGADPAVVTEASAAGKVGEPQNLGGPKGPGAPRYYLGQP